MRKGADNIHPTRLVVIQPSAFCNLDCTYCYLPDRDSRARMSTDFATEVICALVESGLLRDDVTFVWHAGEPLAVPIAFYEHVFSVCRRYSRHRISHAIQTNGTLLHDDWCALFKENAVHVGLSLDGPREIHDLHRRYRSKMGSFDGTLRGLQLLQKHDVDFNVIAVLTAASLEYPESIWSFFASHGVKRLAFNPEEVDGINTRSSLGTPGSYRQFKAFFQRILRKAEYDPSSSCMMVREFAQLQNLLDHANSFLEYNDQNTAFSILTVSQAGRVSTFSPELMAVGGARAGRFAFFDYKALDVSKMTANSDFRCAAAEIRRGVENCRKVCAYFCVCGGGSPSNKFCENGSFASTETVACRLKVKAVTDAFLEYQEAQIQ